MNADQKKRIAHELSNWANVKKYCSYTVLRFTGNRMAALLQELIDAPEAEPFAVIHLDGSFVHVEFKQPIAGTGKFEVYAAPSVPEVLAATNSAQISSLEPAPFGYFKAEPFGWTDCAETDDGAIALYTAPPAPSVSDGWRPFLTDVITAAGLLEHGKRDKGLAGRIGKFAFDAMRAAPPAPKLSDERIKELSDIHMNMYGFDDVAFARAIEREILGGGNE